MLADCEAGKIDIILTKSIQRFARNTVDLLTTVRHLKDLGIEVRFEKEHIRSLTGDGELMLSILASFAQEESCSISENVKWATRKRFAKGVPNGRFRIYGYRWQGDQLVPEPKEASVVKLIYDNFLKGLSAETTEKQLEEMGIKSFNGKHFGNSAVRGILENITYTGNLLFQKAYSADPITGKTKINHGELPQYFVENTHEPLSPWKPIKRYRKKGKDGGNWGLWQTGPSIPAVLPPKSGVESAGRVLCIFAVNGKIRIAGPVFPIKREEEPAVLRELSHRKS